MRRVPMLTITELREQGYTTFTRQYIGKLIADGAITGVEVVGKTYRIPATKANLKALKRERREKLRKSHSDDKTT